LFHIREVLASNLGSEAGFICKISCA